MNVLVQNHSGYPIPNQRAGMVEVIAEQERAGVDVVTDGQVHWHDPISYVTGALAGIRQGDTARYFDTDCYFPTPMVTATIHRARPIAVDDFLLACRSAQRPVKPVLPGPYTLARLCTIAGGPYASFDALAFALSDVLAAEVSDLAGAGAQVIQIDEPAIVSLPAGIRLLRRLLEPLWAARGSARLIVATYFGDAAPLYAELNSLPADILALDLPNSPTLAALIGETGASKELALGVVNARRPEIEEASQVARQIDMTLKRYVLDTLHLLPSCGLQWLPAHCARAKLTVLATSRQLLSAAA